MPCGGRTPKAEPHRSDVGTHCSESDPNPRREASEVSPLRDSFPQGLRVYLVQAILNEFRAQHFKAKVSNPRIMACLELKMPSSTPDSRYLDLMLGSWLYLVGSSPRGSGSNSPVLPGMMRILPKRDRVSEPCPRPGSTHEARRQKHSELRKRGVSDNGA